VSGELTQVRDALGPEPADGGVDSAADGESEGADSGTEAAEVDDVTDSPDGGTTEADDESDDSPGIPVEDAESEAGDDGDADPEEIESRETIEESLDGVVPMMGESPDPEPNGHDEDAEVTPDAD
jgi:hypothetical protein